MDASKEMDDCPDSADNSKTNQRFSFSSSCASSVSVSHGISQRKISMEEGSDSGRKSNTQSTTPDLSQNESETDASPTIRSGSERERSSSAIRRGFGCAGDVIVESACAIAHPATPAPTMSTSYELRGDVNEDDDDDEGVDMVV